MYLTGITDDSVLLFLVRGDLSHAFANRCMRSMPSDDGDRGTGRGGIAVEEDGEYRACVLLGVDLDIGPHDEELTHVRSFDHSIVRLLRPA